MGHSRTPTQNTSGDGFPAGPIDCENPEPRNMSAHRRVCALPAAYGRSCLTPLRMLRLTVVRRPQEG